MYRMQAEIPSMFSLLLAERMIAITVAMAVVASKPDSTVCTGTDPRERGG